MYSVNMNYISKFAWSIRSRQALSLLTVLGTLSLSRAAVAQTTPVVDPPTEAALAARRTLVERAQMAAHAGRHQEALSHADAAGRIEMSPSLRMFIAQERSALGMHALAMEAADQCVREANRNVAVDRRESILTQCRQIAHDSQGHVVVVTVTAPVARMDGLVVRVGSRALTRSEIGVPFNVDPGLLVVEATAPGVEPFREQRDGVAGAVVSFAIGDRFAQPAPRAVPTAQTGTIATHTTINSVTNTGNSAMNLAHTSGPQSSVGLAVTPPTADSRGPRRMAGVVVAGVGVVSMISSLVAWRVYEGVVSAYNADANCPGTSSVQPQGVCAERVASASTLQTGSLVAGIGGGVLAAAGAVIIATSLGRASAEQPRVACVPMVGPDRVGVSIHATF